MNANDGPQQALQIAFQTLKERCRQFQEHISVLEAENVKLRVQQVNQPDADSLSGTEVQQRRIRELSEQNSQLQTHLKIVTDENRQLWTKLSKLSEVNKSLGTHLTRINDTLAQHSSKQPVTRSKTFTISDSTKKSQQKDLVDENEKVSLELEDISLKLINSIAKEKMELELQCSQMMEIQNSNFLAGSYAAGKSDSENEIADTVIDEYLQGFNGMKYVLSQERDKLTSILHKLRELSVIKEKKIEAQAEEPRSIAVPCNENNDAHNKEVSPSSQNVLVANEQEENLQPDISAVEKICPVCSWTFSDDITFMEFQHHVVEHFIAEDHPEYDVL